MFSLYAKITPLAFRVWQRNLSVWLKFYKASLVGNIGDPLFFLLALGFGLGRYMPPINGMSYIQFLAPGMVLSSAMYSAVFECTFGSYTRMDSQRTFEAIICTPVGIEEVIVGEALWGATKSLITGLVILAILLVFGLLPSPLAFFVPLVVILEGLMFASLSLVFTAFAPSYDFFSYYFSFIITPMYLFSGIFFPLEGLPDWVTVMAWFMPLTHVVNLGRGLVLGQLHFSYLYDVLWLAVFTLITFSIALHFIRKRLVK